MCNWVISCSVAGEKPQRVIGHIDRSYYLLEFPFVTKYCKDGAQRTT